MLSIFRFGLEWTSIRGVLEYHLVSEAGVRIQFHTKAPKEGATEECNITNQKPKHQKTKRNKAEKVPRMPSEERVDF